MWCRRSINDTCAPPSFSSLPGGLGQHEAVAVAAASASPVQQEQRNFPFPGALEVDTKVEEEGEVNLMQPPARAKKNAKKGKMGGAKDEEFSHDSKIEVRHEQISDRRRHLRFACMTLEPRERTQVLTR